MVWTIIDTTREGDREQAAASQGNAASVDVVTVVYQYIRNLPLTSTSTLYPAAIRSRLVATFFGVGICTRVTASRAV